MYPKYDFSQKGLANCFFFVCERANEQFAQKNKQFAQCSFAHLLWATWVNCSQLLIGHERPERFAQIRSFVLSDLSDLSESLTVVHLIWANERRSEFFSICKNETPIYVIKNSTDTVH